MRFPACIAIMVSGLLLAPVHAQNVSLTGTVRPGTCTLNNPTHTMPPVSADKFPATAGGGVADSYTPFSLALTACSGVKGARLTFGAAADAAPAPNATIFRNKLTTGAAPNTGIWLQEGACSATGTTVAPGSTLARTFSGTHTEALCAQYTKVGTGEVTAGDISSTFTVTVDYQ
ncbi:fimbrial protein [Stenotrophomonas rhizophila]|uniref:Fimbrial protein n=2 Tax=Stenotrophomonas rhizophila TaxID=216778 RepID=A0A7V8CC43_9GAMM|nr:fimbrial protein [Stenotrophomonas rhizophila]